MRDLFKNNYGTIILSIVVLSIASPFVLSAIGVHSLVAVAIVGLILGVFNIYAIMVRTKELYNVPQGNTLIIIVLSCLIFGILGLQTVYCALFFIAEIILLFPKGDNHD